MPKFSFILTGKVGMNNAVWKKLKVAPFPALYRRVYRDLNGWEVGVVEFDEIEPEELKGKIGQILLKKYQIEFS